jgi:hypothetical protein
MNPYLWKKQADMKLEGCDPNFLDIEKLDCPIRVIEDNKSPFEDL